MKKLFLIAFIAHCPLSFLYSQNLPDTGISGVYEVMVGAPESQKNYLIKYFGEFGFSVKDSANYTAAQAMRVYCTVLESERL